ncbi:MAG: hypothetical protein ACLSB9_20595 [Hydrogeniiclostridium mannosilyticum]
MRRNENIKAPLHCCNNARAKTTNYIFNLPRQPPKVKGFFIAAGKKALPTTGGPK